MITDEQMTEYREWATELRVFVAEIESEGNRKPHGYVTGIVDLTAEVDRLRAEVERLNATTPPGVSRLSAYVRLKDRPDFTVYLLSRHAHRAGEEEWVICTNLEAGSYLDADGHWNAPWNEAQRWPTEDVMRVMQRILVRDACDMLHVEPRDLELMVGQVTP